MNGLEAERSRGKVLRHIVSFVLFIRFVDCNKNTNYGKPYSLKRHSKNNTQTCDQKLDGLRGGRFSQSLENLPSHKVREFE